MKRSKFSLSHYHQTTFDMGELVPIGLVPACPGDSFKHHTSMLTRAVAMLAPVMHKLNLHIHHWFVPMRLVWVDWEDFITGGSTGNAAPVFPTITFASVAKGSLANYLGVPVSATPVTVSALPFRMFNMIWNEKYRDQDIQTARVISTASGADTTTDTTLPYVCWDKDFFTTSRPWTQLGSAVTIPLTGNAPVERVPGNTNTALLRDAATGNLSGTFQLASSAGDLVPNGAPSTKLQLDPNGTMRANLSSVSGVALSDLRTAAGVQRFRENNAAFGYRYSDFLNYRFGISKQDARLQEPEYLGGGRQVMQFSEVIQTAQGSDPVGTLRGHGIGAIRTNAYRAFIPEHGYILSLAFLRPQPIYANALQKHWSLNLKEQWPTKELEAIGRQPIYNREIYVNHSTPSGVFGYQNQYENWRRMHSRLSGDFADLGAGFFGSWTMARFFTSDVALNNTFLQCNPSKRNFASTSTDAFLAMANHKIAVRRFLNKDGSYTAIK